MFASLPAAQKWLLRDLYGLSLAIATIQIQFMNGQVTTAELTNATVSAGTCSANSARTFVEKARELGFVSFPPGEAIWTQRPLTLNPSLLQPIVAILKIGCEAAAMVIPELLGLEDRMVDGEAFRRLLAAGGIMFIAGCELFEIEPNVAFFLGRFGGGRFLEAMTAEGADDQTGSPRAIPLRRSELSAAMGVSRVHLNRLLSDAEEQGQISCRGGMIALSVDCSKAYRHFQARHFELTFRASLVAGLT